MKHQPSHRSLIVLLSFAVLLFACNKEHAPDCFQTAGIDTLVIREIGGFDQIELRDYIQYELYDSSAYMIELRGPRNLLPDIVTEINNGKLLIKNNNTCNFVRSFKKRLVVRIYSPQFHNIQNFSTGDITSINTINGDLFKIENRNAAGNITLSLITDTVVIASHTGVADVTLKGTCDELYLFNQGVGKLDAREIIASQSFVNNSSVNDVWVYAQNYLYAYIKYSGNIFYRGSPTQIDRTINGSGKLIELP